MPISKHPWFRQRGYIHFDLPIGTNQAESIATNPQRVKRHAFYPFISYEIKSKKVGKGEDGVALTVKEKVRPVSYASHTDSAIYSYYAYMLDQKYEKAIKNIGLENNVLAFRKLGKSNIDFANDAFNYIIDRKFCAAIAFDIEGFFNNLNHLILKKEWCRILETDMLPEDHYNVYKSLTRFSCVERDCLYKKFNISKNNRDKKKNKRICEPEQFRKVVRENGMIKINNSQKGIPQGSPISALLSNIYMLKFDNKISSLTKEINGAYFRYCDDILCIVPVGRKSEIITKINNEIKSLNLIVNKEKTNISEFKILQGKLSCDKPLQYLGFTFDGNHKLIRSAAFSKFSERMKSGVRLAKLTKIKYNRIRTRKGVKKQELYKRKIYEKYSHLGKRNFIRYGFRCAEIMESASIRKQLRPLWRRLQEEIKK